MVVTPQPIASETGIAVLRDGGNAVDAAVAASAMLMVTAPMQCGPGGDAIWLMKPPAGAAITVNGTGRSGSRLDPGVARTAARRQGDRGAWTVTVPGAVSSWVDVLTRFGSKSLEELLRPVIEVAEGGFFVSRYLHAAFVAAQDVLRRSRQGGDWFLRNGVPAIHSRLRQPQLARTLRVLAATDGDALYHGQIATAIADAVARSGGFLTEEDLAAHTTGWDEPLSLVIDGLDLLQAPPNSQGVVLLEALGISRVALGTPFADLERMEELHVLVEALRASLADRDAAVGDQVGDGDIETLLSDDYHAARAAAIDRAQAAHVWSPGLGNSSGGLARRDGDTANLVVIDQSGFAVSLTQSLYYDFGSGIPVDGWGFMLHNRGACFSSTHDGPNAIAPARRPLHTLMPAMALADGRVRYVFGCMGGHGQGQTQAQLLARLAAGDDPQEAVAAPRFFVDADARGASLYVEAGAPIADYETLSSYGHSVQVLDRWEEIMGHAQLIAVEPSGAIVGGSDPRTDGYVAAC